MDATTFWEKLKQHCTDVEANCVECCFRDFCYCPPKDYDESLLASAIGLIPTEL